MAGNDQISLISEAMGAAGNRPVWGNFMRAIAPDQNLLMTIPGRCRISAPNNHCRDSAQRGTVSSPELIACRIRRHKEQLVRVGVQPCCIRRQAQTVHLWRAHVTTQLVAHALAALFSQMSIEIMNKAGKLGPWAP